MTKLKSHKQIEKLKKEINRHNFQYYVLNDPIISDFEYDKLLKQLIELETEYPEFITPDSPTQRVGGEPIKEFKQVSHSPLMLSLDNTYSYDELREFNNRVKKSLNRFNYVVEQKVDGVAVSLKYRNGLFVQGATRGDGATGDDVTINLKTILSIPLQIFSTSKLSNEFEIRGEVFLTKQQFSKLNKEREQNEEPLFANPRNAAAGSLKLLDPKQVASRKLDIFVHTIPKSPVREFTSDSQTLELLKEIGFKVIPHSELFDSIENVIKYCEQWKEKRHKLPYEVDGMVVKIDNFADRVRLGETIKSPRWAVAYKYPPMQATTKILNIIFSVGRTGVVTPVANMEPVLLSGSTISHSTLHNFDEISRKDIRINDTVIIEKAGEVIPQVVKVILEKRTKNSKTLRPPSQCPVCKSRLFKETEEVAIRCINASCPAQIKGRLLLFACRSAMDINGLGFALVEMLVNKKLVCDFADLYDLKYDDLIELERMGEKSVNNLLQAIQDSKKRPYNRVLFALGIRHIGVHTSRILVSSFPSFDELCNAKKEDIAGVMGIGPAVAESVRNFFDDKENIQLIERLKKAGLNFSEDVSNKGEKPLIGKTFVLTGTLKNYTREQVTEIIIELGGNVSSSVSKKTNCVLAGDEPGSKYDKAQKLGVKIINEQDFNKMVKKK